jgi:hypothetical protein
VKAMRMKLNWCALTRCSEVPSKKRASTGRSPLAGKLVNSSLQAQVRADVRVVHVRLRLLSVQADLCIAPGAGCRPEVGKVPP